MKSEWRVKKNIIGESTIYGVYRLKDNSKVNHSGNQEVPTLIDGTIFGDCFRTKEEAYTLVSILNSYGE